MRERQAALGSGSCCEVYLQRACCSVIEYKGSILTFDWKVKHNFTINAGLRWDEELLTAKVSMSLPLPAEKTACTEKVSLFPQLGANKIGTSTERIDEGAIGPTGSGIGRDTLLHIIGGAWIWLAYWKEPSPSPAFLTDLRTRRGALFEPDAFPNVAAVQLKWAEVEEEQTEFVNRITTESLETLLPFRETQVRLAHLMQHLANHSTYHRGQIALMMRQLNVEPLATDFHVFLVEGRREFR